MKTTIPYNLTINSISDIVIRTMKLAYYVVYYDQRQTELILNKITEINRLLDEGIKYSQALTNNTNENYPTCLILKKLGFNQDTYNDVQELLNAAEQSYCEAIVRETNGLLELIKNHISNDKVTKLIKEILNNVKTTAESVINDEESFETLQTNCKLANDAIKSITHYENIYKQLNVLNTNKKVLQTHTKIDHSDVLRHRLSKDGITIVSHTYGLAGVFLNDKIMMNNNSPEDEQKHHLAKYASNLMNKYSVETIIKNYEQNTDQEIPCVCIVFIPIATSFDNTIYLPFFGCSGGEKIKMGNMLDVMGVKCFNSLLNEYMGKKIWEDDKYEDLFKKVLTLKSQLFSQYYDNCTILKIKPPSQQLAISYTLYQKPYDEGLEKLKNRQHKQYDLIDHIKLNPERWSSRNCSEPVALIAIALLYSNMVDSYLTVPFQIPDKLNKGSLQQYKETCGWCACAERSFTTSTKSNTLPAVINMYKVHLNETDNNIDTMNNSLSHTLHDKLVYNYDTKIPNYVAPTDKKDNKEEEPKIEKMRRLLQLLNDHQMSHYRPHEIMTQIQPVNVSIRSTNTQTNIDPLNPIMNILSEVSKSDFSAKDQICKALILHIQRFEI